MPPVFAMAGCLYFDAEHAVREQEKIIKLSGGLAGVKNRGQIDSVLEHIQNDIYYPEFEDKLNHLVYSIIKNHSFNDGNKRSSIALGAFFLEINGFEHRVRLFVTELENIVVYVAENHISKDLLKEIISSLIYEGELSESVKLSLLNAIDDENR